MQRARFRLVVLDLQMPFVDGVTLAKRVRAAEAAAGIAPAYLVAVTSNGEDPRCRAEAMQAGFNEVICKPLNIFVAKYLVQSMRERARRS